MNPNNLCPFPVTRYLLFLAAAFFASSLAGVAQTSIAVAPNKMNVFYIGVDNPVSVAASGSADDKVTVSVSGGEATVAKLDAGLYNVRVGAVTNECVLTVKVDGKAAGTSVFRVRNLPMPSGTVAGFASGSKIPADVFRSQAGVGVYIKDFPFDVRYDVLGYTFSVDDGKGDIKSADSEGAGFSAQAKQHIEQHVKPGRTVTIDGIRVKDAGGRVLKIPALVYYIQ